MPDPTSPDTDELRRRIEGATPGPWEVGEEAFPGGGFMGYGQGAGILGPAPEGQTRWAQIVEGGEQDEQGGAVGVLLPADAAFIAAANPAAITVLLDAFEASVAREAVLRAENERLRPTACLQAHDMTIGDQTWPIRCQMDAGHQHRHHGEGCAWGRDLSDTCEPARPLHPLPALTEGTDPDAE